MFNIYHDTFRSLAYVSSIEKFRIHNAGLATPSSSEVLAIAPTTLREFIMLV
jgi:hypothetical protein